mgnify:CR=1 FL=1
MNEQELILRRLGCQASIDKWVSMLLVWREQGVGDTATLEKMIRLKREEMRNITLDIKLEQRAFK